mmetsp:Transcript_9466/g.30272  ORF Transcript_9466/g.30272 Transcript_9466/m.30272 type:complete len:108 (+) Transcript_9466:1-324(+)
MERCKLAQVHEFNLVVQDHFFLLIARSRACNASSWLLRARPLASSTRDKPFTGELCCGSVAFLSGEFLRLGVERLDAWLRSGERDFVGFMSSSELSPSSPFSLSSSS